MEEKPIERKRSLPSFLSSLYLCLLDLESTVNIIFPLSMIHDRPVLGRRLVEKGLQKIERNREENSFIHYSFNLRILFDRWLIGQKLIHVYGDLEG
jgi:hypothetical protein